MARQRLIVRPSIVQPDDTGDVVAVGPTWKCGDLAVIDYFLPFDPWTRRLLPGHGQQGAIIGFTSKGCVVVELKNGEVMAVEQCMLKLPKLLLETQVAA